MKTVQELLQTLHLIGEHFPVAEQDRRLSAAATNLKQLSVIATKEEDARIELLAKLITIFENNPQGLWGKFKKIFQKTKYGNLFVQVRDALIQSEIYTGFLKDFSQLDSDASGKKIRRGFRKVKASIFLVRPLRRYYYARKANRAFAMFQDAQQVSIRDRSQPNLNTVKQRLKVDHPYYAEEVRGELQGKIFTQQELPLVEKMLHSDEWTIQHATFDIDQILVGNNTVLSLEERKRRGLCVDNNHSIAADGNTDNIFFSIGFGQHAPPRFLDQDVKKADRIIVNLSEMQRVHPEIYEQLWTSGHVAAYGSERRSEILFGRCHQEVQYHAGLTKIYNYDGGKRTQTLQMWDEIVVGKDIKMFLICLFIERLRSIGGAYRQHILDNTSTLEAAKKAFHQIFNASEMEVHIPAKLFLDPRYVTIYTGAIYIKELCDAAAVGDINKIQELLSADSTEVDAINFTVDFSKPHTALQAACANGHTAAAELLLMRGARIGLRYTCDMGIFESYQTALMFAAERGHLACVQLLIEWSKRNNCDHDIIIEEDVDIINSRSVILSHDPIGAFGLAFRNGRWPIAILLAEQGANN